MSNFEKLHSGGETYRKYKKIEHKLTEEFQDLTKDLMTELYIRDQMGRKYWDDWLFNQSVRKWNLILRELGVEYPYRMDVFPHAHPFTREAAIAGKKRLGIAS